MKAVLNAIPIYPMNCFKFPVQTCKEHNSLISNFWWKGSNDGSVTHWKSWSHLSQSKLEGGMGFRDFVTMNNALGYR